MAVDPPLPRPPLTMTTPTPPSLTLRAFVLQVMKGDDVYVQVPHGDMVPPQEAIESLFKIWKVTKSG